MFRPIHPFPARMAPELALATLKDLPADSLVLDPMTGSGTVLRQASDLGHRSVGFDMDPLAVLMSKVITTPVQDGVIQDLTETVIREAKSVDPERAELPWIDNDDETKNFIEYWFAQKQRIELRKLAFVLADLSNRELTRAETDAADVLRLNLSRIIVTKEMGASLARDTSHSRPHRVADESDYDVFSGFQRSLKTVRKRLTDAPPTGGAAVSIGDARAINLVAEGVVDAVLTSPPYLNAIDYLRGHRLSLVWLGNKLGDLRTIRSDSVGAERAPNKGSDRAAFVSIKQAMAAVDEMPRRYQSMIDRYAEDIYRIVSEIARVLKDGGHATFVVGNSCLKGVFIRNSEGVATAARLLGLDKVSESERELPSQSRYLPMSAGALSKRMRTETILTFAKASAVQP